MTKQTILVYAYHSTDCCAGFDWAPDTQGNRIDLMRTLREDEENLHCDSASLVTIRVPKCDNSEWITGLIDGELQDAIEVGSVGHILARFHREACDE
jgi:hypothetical protein